MNFADIGMDALPMLVPGLIAQMIFSLYVRQPPLHTAVALLVAMAFAKGSQLLTTAFMPANIGIWQPAAEFFIPLVAASIAGAGAGEFTRHRDRKRRANRSKPEKAQSDPMRWGAMFRGERKHLMLQMKDGRTIVGWPEGWPHDHQNGHFLLANPRVLGEKVGAFGYSSVATIIPAADVNLIRFLREDAERVGRAWDDLIQAGEENVGEKTDVNFYR